MCDYVRRESEKSKGDKRRYDIVLRVTPADNSSRYPQDGPERKRTNVWSASAVIAHVPHLRLLWSPPRT